MNTLCSKSNRLLSWSHYKTLLQVFDKEAKEWYENEALGQTWSVRTLQRNISSQYYYRYNDVDNVANLSPNKKY